MSKVKPQVIDDEEHERVHDRVAAADVAKDAGVVCTRMSHRSRPGARQSAIWTVKARMGDGVTPLQWSGNRYVEPTIVLEVATRYRTVFGLTAMAQLPEYDWVVNLQTPNPRPSIFERNWPCKKNNMKKCL